MITSNLNQTSTPSNATTHTSTTKSSVQPTVSREERSNMNSDDSATLHSAAQEGHLEVVKLLIEKGADFKSPDKDGRAPLIKKAIEEFEEKYPDTYVDEVSLHGNKTGLQR